ncbi:unnamed protein product [Danaus chrysippus]|uniref:(African queen) hypothetical protein n=1 Tax=Danaus chrysippus TaxID=151541 RepID=A0A8J2R5V3_9NEOP|nr:unnamed protein product [Danaus chrysippus]
MSKTCKSINRPRSRLPIDEETIRLWNLSSNENTSDQKTKDEATKTESKDRNFGEIEKDITLEVMKEKHSINKQQLAQNITTSIKEKSDNKNTIKSEPYAVHLKVGYGRDDGTVITSNADVEDTSNPNENRDGVGERNLDSIISMRKVDFCGVEADSISHASGLRMGPGGALALWSLNRNSSAAGAGVGSLQTEEMPVSNSNTRKAEII